MPPTADLDDAEEATLAALLRQVIAAGSLPAVVAHSDAAHNPRQAGAAAGTATTASGAQASRDAQPVAWTKGRRRR